MPLSGVPKEILELVAKRKAAAEAALLTIPGAPPRSMGATEFIGIEIAHACGGAAPPEVVEYRLRICGGCEHRKTEHEGRSDPVGWCSLCSCGASDTAKLTNKARLAAWHCYAGKFLQCDGVGGSIKSALEAAGAIAKTAIFQAGRKFNGAKTTKEKGE